MSHKSQAKLPRFRMSLSGEEAVQVYNSLIACKEHLTYEGKLALFKMEVWIAKLDSGLLTPSYIPVAAKVDSNSDHMKPLASRVNPMTHKIETEEEKQTREAKELADMNAELAGFAKNLKQESLVDTL